MKTKLLLIYLLKRKPKDWGTFWKGIVPVNYLLLVLMALYSFAPAHLSKTSHIQLPVSHIPHLTSDPQQTITGTVSDAGGPIPGVFVQVKDTNRTTMTDENGYYSISASPGEVLVFSFPGYETLERIVGIDTVIDIEMFESITHLEEAVINAGYYTVKDRERTGSIYRITADEIEKQPVNNVLEALQGRVPGLDIVSTTGLAGGGYTVRIRGQNSIAAGNEPLYIIDGVPYDTNSMGNIVVSGTILYGGNISPLNTLDPSSIESVEILKDADATAIYGSRGANGVVLITTKKGKKGKTSITADARYTLLSLTNRMDLMNTEQYLAMREKAFANDGFAEFPAYAYDVNGTWDRERYTDWQDYFLGNPAFNSTINLQVNGGGEHTSFHLGVSTIKETTIYPMDYSYNRLSSNFGLNHRSKDERLKVGLSFNFGKDRNNLPGSDIRPVAIKLAPNAPVLYNEDGSLNWENNQWENPLAALNATYKNNTYNFIANSNMQYEILKGFDFKINIGYNQSHLDEIRLNPHTVFNPSYGLTSANSMAYNNTGKRNSWIIEPQFEGKFKVGKGAVDLLIGATMQEANSEYLALYGVGFPSNYFIENLSSAKTIRFLNDTDSKYKYLAGFARLNYKLHNKYILNLTARRDGSSRFGPGKKFSNFGAIGVAWILSRENFLKNSEWLSFGKLRTSIGITGNDQIGNYQYLDSYTIGGNSYGGNISLSPTRLFNPDYAWERNRKIEAALEMGFLSDRLSAEIGYYHILSDNQLLYIPMPGTTGFSGINGNLNAEVENYGWEFNIHSQNIKGNNFHWTSSLLFSLPYNNLKSFEGLENSTYVNRLVVGMPITITRFYHYTGINPETGVFEFEDYNGDGKISEEDRKYFVDLTPKYYGNFSNQISYKNLSLDFMFQFVKRKGLNSHYYGVTPGLMFNQPTDVLDETSMQIYTSGFNADALTAYTNFKWSNGAISDASFIRLKTVSLSYRLPKNLIGFADCTINFQGQNLWTITKYKNGDPEQNGDYTSNLKRISFGVNVTF